MGCFRRALRLERARWCPAWVLPGLGLLFGVRGTPRCPVATARAVAALAWHRGDCWGPAPLRHLHRQCWEELLGWVRAPFRLVSPSMHFATMRMVSGSVFDLIATGKVANKK